MFVVYPGVPDNLTEDPGSDPQLGQYKEQSELLDPLLEDLVGSLTIKIRNSVSSAGFWESKDLCRASPLLWALASTRYANSQAI